MTMLVDMQLCVPLRRGAGDARRQRRQRREAAVGERQVLDRFGRDGERPLAARRLDQRASRP